MVTRGLESTRIITVYFYQIIALILIKTIKKITDILRIIH